LSHATCLVAGRAEAMCCYWSDVIVIVCSELPGVGECRSLREWLWNRTTSRPWRQLRQRRAVYGILP